MSRLIKRIGRLIKIGALVGAVIAIGRMIARKRQQSSSEATWPTIAEKAAQSGKPVEAADPGSGTAEADTGDSSAETADSGGASEDQEAQSADESDQSEGSEQDESGAWILGTGKLGTDDASETSTRLAPDPEDAAEGDAEGSK